MTPALRPRRLLAPTAAVLAAALLAACGGDDKPATTAAGDASTTTLPAPEPGADTTLPGAADGTTTTVLGGAPAPGGPTTTAKAGGGAATTTVKGGAPSAASPGVGARPGKYTYAVTGTGTGGTPPTTRQYSGEITTTIDPANGRDQRSSTGGENAQELILRHEADKVLLVQLSTRGQLSKDFKPTTPVLAQPRSGAAGTKWSWELTSTDATTTIRGDFTLAGEETLPVGGVADKATKVDFKLVITTSFNGAPVTVTQTGTRWSSNARNVQVKEVSTLDSPFGKADTVSTLRSLDPG